MGKDKAIQVVLNQLNKREGYNFLGITESDIRTVKQNVVNIIGQIAQKEEDIGVDNIEDIEDRES